MRSFCWIVSICGIVTTTTAFSQLQAIRKNRNGSRMYHREATTMKLSKRLLETSQMKDLMLRSSATGLNSASSITKDESCHSVATFNFGSLIATSFLVLAIAAAPVFADEYGVEKDAPTLFTGETVEVGT
jgi:hypothetical protein